MLTCRTSTEAASSATASTTNLFAPGPGPGRFAAAGAAIAALVSAPAHADDAASLDEDKLQSIEVTGTAIHTSQDISQATDTVDKKELAEQNLSLVQDALRNVPGITLNAGEGGSHGDSVNLRGLSIPDSFFLDGVRDIGQYQRDTFNTDSIAVLLGPASALFGRGSTSGVINSVSKQPMLTPLAAFSVSAGQIGYGRVTGDVNVPLSESAAARITVMDQSNGVVERDQVHYHRYGVAPTLSFGLDTPTRLILSYYKEEENNLPDYGIPFIDGAPAHVQRSNYYSLANYDRTRTNTNIGTIRLEHDFEDGITLSDSLRYANYGFEYLVTGPFLGNDFTPPPLPRTPYAAIDISRDQPSSAGTTSLAINRTDLTLKFDVGAFKHTLTGGLEVSQEQSNVNRFQNGIDDIPPTPLLNPVPFFVPPTPLTPYSNPKGRGSDVSVYALDSIAFGPKWDVDAGLRWDRFKSSFSEVFSGTAFDRTDTFVSPRAAVIYKPDAEQSYYFSYGTSQNPVIEYLIVAPSDQSLSPEKNNTLELGGRLKILHGEAQLTGAVFDTRVSNARISDPNDPTVQQSPFDQQVKGLEIGVQGYVTESWEVIANYTHLSDKITAVSAPLSQGGYAPAPGSNATSRGKFAPNTPHDALNFWTTVEPSAAWTIGGGFTAVSRRFADTENSAGVPAYVVFNAMTSYEFNPHFKLQLNLNNVTDKLYFTSIYFVGIAENHALPAAGRTLIGTASYRF
ncbi:MAG: TonB-dependent siderophore receptor [Pseudomonadota bacterium]|nr:TonB-dependent siderophore receptor [Pseudomonadota bacterium]